MSTRPGLNILSKTKGAGEIPAPELSKTRYSNQSTEIIVTFL